MTPLRKTSSLLLLLTIGLVSSGQQLVQTPKDIELICRDDSLFIGKPLSVLFKEIKPAITLVLPREGWVLEVAPLFTFFFTSMEVFQAYRKKDGFPLRLRVYLSEPFKWEKEKRKGYGDKNHYLDWTKEDEEAYRHLIVTAIRIAGTYDARDYNTNQQGQ